MPVINGKVVRSRYAKLDLLELSSVDNPAQPGALASIMKRHDPTAPVTKHQPSITAIAVAKYISEDDGAHTFDQVLQANQFDEKIWPMVSALSQSLRSIMGDKDIKMADKETKVTQSVDEFLAAVRDLSPTAEKQLAKAISKGTSIMNWEQIAKDREAEITTLKADLATAKAATATAEQKAKDAEEGKMKAEKALSEATEEVIKVDETTEIRKSLVGDAQFAVFKAMDAKATMATLEKRATDEYGHVVGTAVEKAAVLKAVAGMPEEARKTFDRIMTSAEKMAKAAFDTFGVRADDADKSADVAKAASTFKAKVSEIAKRDGISEMRATSKARVEFPEEFAAAYPDQAEAA